MQSKDLRDELLRIRYCLRDQQGRIVETPDQMFRRVASAVAEAERAYGATDRDIAALAERFLEIMQRSLFLPNSPTLMNAGRKDRLLSACFVLPVEDSLDGIFQAVHEAVTIQTAGGGTGFAFDLLRPTGDLVQSTGGTTSGPIGFMRVFSEATGAIQQGSLRRGANMGLMSIEHPDILKFIRAKHSPNAFTNFNLSVKVTDEFMRRLEQETHDPHIVNNPRTGQRYLLPRGIDVDHYVLGELLPEGTTAEPCFTVLDIWNMIVEAAWASGEPGICFIDRVNADNPTPHVGEIRATNPCGEQPLLDYEACNLGSANLRPFIDRERQQLRWRELAHAAKLGVQFLDNVIDINHYPLEKTREVTLANRKIGMGIMGFADALILMGIRYDSKEAVEFARDVARLLQQAAHEASNELARVRGSFENWPGSRWDAEQKQLVRNATCTTIAPTGSISIIAGCSSGIEPVFSFACRRRALDGQEFVQLHPLLEQLGRAEGWMDERVEAALLEGVPPTEVPGIPQSIAQCLVTAHDVPPEHHVRVQAAFQGHTDNAVSKTVNLRADAKPSDVDTVFRMAFELGCKGVTVYRDGSREGQTLSAADELALAPHAHPRPRPHTTVGRTLKFRMGCGTLFVTVNRDGVGICEVFANLGKAGGCPSQSEATCRAVSAALRSGVDPEVLIEQLRGIRCLSTCVARKGNKDVQVLSCPDAIARAMEKAVAGVPTTNQTAARNTCPECGLPLRKEAGCLVCDCGYTKCG